ncbi:MAG: dTMP kinase [Erysipelothrix sp.]|nr:dTMP kinase [Erysipelothrix sp.]
MRNKGLFITFEGPDGSGKTTISKLVAERLEQCGYASLYTREPGGNRISESIRDIILDVDNVNMDIRTEALLYAASRRQHLQEKIVPALLENKIVICDRFIDSSLAYQGYARDIGIEDVLKINEFAIEGHYPDITLFLDISAEEGLARIEGRDHKDRLDLESLDFHQRVYDGYQMVLKQFKERMVVIDAERAIDDIVNEAVEIIIKGFKNE